MLRKEIKVISKSGISYQLENGKILKFKPWLGDLFSFKYDEIMEKSIFPKKFKSDMVKHENTIRSELKDIHKKEVLELACGSGSLSKQLPEDNIYIGIDISPGLVKTAVKKFKSAGFKNARFFISDVSDLPFEDNSFDICICSLSLNFFPDTERTAEEIYRVLKQGGCFFCCVPVPERVPEGSTVRGTLHTEAELEKIFTGRHFSFNSFSDQINGALFYFKGEKT